MRDQVREKIAGEICLSEEPGRTIRKWREQFDISQQDLSKHLGVSPSVISDYEAGRRRSPGIATIRKIVDAFLEIDEKTGANVLKQYSLAGKTDSIISIKEFSAEILAPELVDAIKGDNLTPAIPLDTHIHGYTVIDSVRASWKSYYQNISAVLNKGAELAVKPEQAYRAMQVYDAAMTSAETGQAVKLSC